MPTSRPYPPAHDPEDLARFFVDRFNEGDADGLAELYEADAVLSTGDGTIAKGTQEIRAFYLALLDRVKKLTPGQQRPALRNGDLALTSTLLPNGATTAEIAHRRPDGSWRWIIDQPRIAAAPAP